MKKVVRIIVSVVLLAYIAVAVSWSRNMAYDRLCNGIKIEVSDPDQSRFVTSKEVANEIKSFTRSSGKVHLYEINTDSIERVLNSIDKIEHATCKMLTNGYVQIDVMPMHPVARVFDQGDSYYINKDGKRISANARYHVDCPVISGTFTESFTPQQILPVVYHIESDSVLTSLVTHIKADGPNNVILVPLIHGHVINIGNVDNLNDKFYRLNRAYKEILPVKGWNYYDTISVKWNGQIVATRRAKKLNEVISAIDFEAEKEAPDIGTMMVGDTVAKPQNKF